MKTEQYIKQFGGVKKLSQFLGVGRSTVQEWRTLREMPTVAKRFCDVILEIRRQSALIYRADLLEDLSRLLELSADLNGPEIDLDIKLPLEAVK